MFNSAARRAPYFLFFAAIQCVAAGFARADAPDALSDLVDLALRQNPGLEALEAQVAALEFKVARSGAWEDIKLTVAYQNIPVDALDLSQEPMNALRVRVDQKFPFFGKIRRRESVALQSMEARAQRLEEERSRLTKSIKHAYYQLGLSRQLQELTAAHIDLVKQLIDALRIKYETGAAAQHDLLRLEVLRDRLRDDLADFERSAAQLSAGINGILHRDGAAFIATPTSFELPAPSMTRGEFNKLAAKHRPLLKELDAAAAMHRAEAELARAEAVPDPTVFAAYGYRTMPVAQSQARHLLTVGVTLSLPTAYGDRYRARAMEASALARSSAEEKASVVDSIDSGLEANLAQWKRSVQKVNTYTTQLVPQAHRTLDATFAAYQVDRVGFLPLFEAELELLEFEKTIRIATVEGLVAMATVESLVGKELF